MFSKIDLKTVIKIFLTFSLKCSYKLIFLNVICHACLVVGSSDFDRFCSSAHLTLKDVVFTPNSQSNPHVISYKPSHKSSPSFSSRHQSITSLRGKVAKVLLLLGLWLKGKMPVASANINSPLCCKVAAVSEVKLSCWHLNTNALKHTTCALHWWLPGRAHCVTRLTSCFVCDSSPPTVCTSIVSEVKGKQSDWGDSMLINGFSHHVKG